MAPKAEFSLEIGNTVKASSASIAYLWRNWEYLYELNPGVIKAWRTTDNSWQATGFYVQADFYLMRSSFTRDAGLFEYYSFVSFLGARFKINSTLHFKRIDDTTISYFAESFATFPTILKPLHWFMRGIAAKSAQYVVQIGGKTASLITSNPDIVKEKVGQEAFSIYQEFIDEESDIKRGADRTYKHFSGSVENRVHSNNGDHFADLETRLTKLEKALAGADGMARFEDYRTAISVYNTDPRLALVKTRIIIEHIAKIVYENEIGKFTGDERTLGAFIDQMTKRTKKIPANIAALMRSVSLLGNVGGHADDPDACKSQVTASEFYVSFMATIRIAEWFFTEYQPSKARNR